MPESLKEFRLRRFHELEQSGELDQLGDMPVTDFLNMLRNEYYDCADDPAPAPGQRPAHYRQFWQRLRKRVLPG